MYKRQRQIPNENNNVDGGVKGVGHNSSSENNAGAGTSSTVYTKVVKTITTITITKEKYTKLTPSRFENNSPNEVVDKNIKIPKPNISVSLQKDETTQVLLNGSIQVLFQQPLRGVQTVSYTHLDVYKRQVLASAPLPNPL